MHNVSYVVYVSVFNADVASDETVETVHINANAYTNAYC
jgi:hypothetical protein